MGLPRSPGRDGAKMQPSLPSEADALYLKSSEGPCQGKDRIYI